MSSWISRDGGIAKVTPLRYEDADQSVKRWPTEMTTSAEAVRVLPTVEPVSPIVWALSAWVSSIAPLPFQVVTTGAPRRSASASSSSQASAMSTPPPATITGRVAPRRLAAARSTSSAAGRTRPRASRRSGSGIRTSAASAWMSIARSRRIGPGRPLVIAFHARWRTNGRSSTRDGCHHSLTTGSKTRGLSAWCFRSNSWNSPCPRMYVCGDPIARATAVESTYAVPIPMTVFIAPGPMLVNASMGRPVARK